jgi:3',5'-cyclic AMP phosphodiesterase CpdA
MRTRSAAEADGARRTTQPAGAGASSECAADIGTGRSYHTSARRVRLEDLAEPLAIVTLGHISDLHATRVGFWALEPFGSKRFFGWLSWQLRRRHRYRPAVLEALLADLAHTAPDQLAITGDLTQIALDHEFAQAESWLARFGPPSRVNAIPGNHDAYVAVPSERGWQRWTSYLESDPAASPFRGEPADFPTVRVRGELALVGVCTAQPTPPLCAFGRVGAEQLARLDRALEQLRDAGLCRVVLIHHPPVKGIVSYRRSLHDADAFGEVIARRGAELVLHGHLHRTTQRALPGPAGPIPVAGVPSASHAGPEPERCAAYHLYDIDGARGRWGIRRRVRRYDPASGRFVAHGAQTGEWIATSGS